MKGIIVFLTHGFSFFFNLDNNRSGLGVILLCIVTMKELYVIIEIGSLNKMNV